jgi:hypothetical protein
MSISPLAETAPPTEASSETFLGDIPEALALAAHAGSSFVPERRSISTRQGYAESLVATFAELSRHASTDEKRAVLAAEFARFREGYSRRFRAYLASRSRIVSSFIAGPSNFPFRRMEKRGDIAHRRLNDLLEFEKRAKEAIVRTLHPEWRPIMAGDADAIERLELKIEQAESLQERMKAANAAIRTHKKAGVEAQVLALVAIGLKEDQARRLLQPDFCGRVGFPAFELTNNNANLRRMQARLDLIRAAKVQLDTEVVGTAARLEDCPSDNRVRLFFPGKPAAEVRDQMKASGFRWAPSIGAWQAYRHEHTLNAARRFAGVESISVQN